MDRPTEQPTVPNYKTVGRVMSSKQSLASALLTLRIDNIDGFFRKQLSDYIEANGTVTELDFAERELKYIGRLYDDIDFTGRSNLTLQSKADGYIKYLLERLNNATPEQQPYFEREFDDTAHKKMIDKLIRHRLLDENTDKNHFKFVFGGKPKPRKDKPFEKLNWTGDLIDLHYFIKRYFHKESKFWQKAMACFVHKKKSINERSLVTATKSGKKESKYKQSIDNLLR